MVNMREKLNENKYVPTFGSFTPITLIPPTFFTPAATREGEKKIKRVKKERNKEIDAYIIIFYYFKI